jgi:hypothetical protein
MGEYFCFSDAMSPPVMEMTTHGSIAPPVGEENHGGNPPPPVPAFNETSSLDMKVEFMRPEDHPEDLTDISVLQGEISEVLAWRRSSNDPDQKPHFLVRMYVKHVKKVSYAQVCDP